MRQTPAFPGQCATLLRTVAPLLLLVFTAAGGCKSKTAPTPKPAASASAKLASAAPAVHRGLPPLDLPSGPPLVILAGQGVGPIRIGATVATIHRLMEEPCEVKTPEVCRYIKHAVEFYLKDDVTERVYVHRKGRPAGKDASGTEREYGFFNGILPPDLRFGMIPSEIVKALGAPQRTEKVTEPNPYNTVERAYYEGLTVEFDRIPNGNLILGGAIITKSKKPPSKPKK